MTVSDEAAKSANAKIRIVEQTRILDDIEEAELFDLAVKSFNDSSTSSAAKSFNEMNKFIDDLRVRP
jgi:hypothetical protein